MFTLRQRDLSSEIKVQEGNIPGFFSLFLVQQEHLMRLKAPSGHGSSEFIWKTLILQMVHMKHKPVLPLRTISHTFLQTSVHELFPQRKDESKKTPEEFIHYFKKATNSVPSDVAVWVVIETAADGDIMVTFAVAECLPSPLHPSHQSENPDLQVILEEFPPTSVRGVKRQKEAIAPFLPDHADQATFLDKHGALDLLGPGQCFPVVIPSARNNQHGHI